VTGRPQGVTIRVDDGAKMTSCRNGIVNHYRTIQEKEYFCFTCAKYYGKRIRNLGRIVPTVSSTCESAHARATQHNRTEQKQHEEAAYTAIVVEGFNAIDDMVKLKGPKDIRLAKQVAPLSWIANFEGFSWYVSNEANAALIHVQGLFGGKLPMERTLALIKPTAVGELSLQVRRCVRMTEISCVRSERFRSQNYGRNRKTWIYRRSQEEP